jgi:hypothetical protein
MSEFMKQVVAMEIRMDQEKAAAELLKKHFAKYIKNGGYNCFSVWKERLLLHFIIKATIAENSKGSGI